MAGAAMAEGARQAGSSRYSYRRDPSVAAFADDKPVIVFDGYCVLCSGFARFVLRHDRKRRYRLLAAQSPLGEQLYRHYGLAGADYESNILLQDGRVWLKSAGSIRMFEGLGFPWSLVGILRLVPRGLLDRLYDLVARNRLRWFGTRQTCFLPDPADVDRFLG
jgi:predicted DCC family thiol-disulfide oxidoreductase YuxK